MRTILNKIGKYFKRLYQALFNITPVEKKSQKEVKSTLDKYGFSQKRDFEHFDIETIRKLMDLTKAGDFDEDEGVKLLIENRKKINEYKKWYVKLVGYNKPTGELKKMIEDDLFVDRIEMDRKLRKFRFEDEKKRSKIVNKPTEYKLDNSTVEEKIINSKLPDAIKQLMINNPIPKMSKPESNGNGINKVDLAELLRVNKENLNRIK